MQTAIVDWLRAYPLSEFPYYLIPFILIGKSQWFLEFVRRKIWGVFSYAMKRQPIFAAAVVG